MSADDPRFLTTHQKPFLDRAINDNEETFTAAVHRVSRRESPRRVDLIEVCTPPDSLLVTVLDKHGGRGERWGLHNYGLSTKRGFNKANTDLRIKRPRRLWLSPPCTMFSASQNANKDNDQIEFARRLKKSQLIWRRCIGLALIQIKELGGDAHLEHPLRSQAWGQ